VIPDSPSALAFFLPSDSFAYVAATKTQKRPPTSPTHIESIAVAGVWEKMVRASRPSTQSHTLTVPSPDDVMSWSGFVGERRSELMGLVWPKVGSEGWDVSVERRGKGEVEEWMWIEVPETVKKNLHSVSDVWGSCLLRVE
jgi:hypothetical protein